MTKSRLFDVDCKLSYTLATPTDFVFQIHAMQGPDQTVLSESLRLSPPVPVRVYEDPNAGHRFARLQASPGPLTLRYKARVRVALRRAARSAAEVRIGDLPDDVLHNLMPTRYCESDLLGSAALKLFGGLEARKFNTLFLARDRPCTAADSA